LRFISQGRPALGSPLRSYRLQLPFPGEEITVQVAFDTPTSEHVNITEFFPSSFSLISSVTLKKYSDDTLVATATVSVSLEETDGNYRFVIEYTDAPDVLSSLEWYEWVVIEYKLRAPSESGTYEFPATQIDYVILKGD